MDECFHGKSVLITGGGRGIGKGIVMSLFKLGATTHVLDKDQGLLDVLRKECEGISTVCVDLRDWKATRKVVEDLGPIDLLVNNAGVAIQSSFMTTDEDSYDSTMEVNLKACFNISQVAARGMMERGTGGSIVMIASSAALVAYTPAAAYSVSKAGLVSLTKNMAKELGQHQIRTNAVCPSFVLTELARPFYEDPSNVGLLASGIPIGRIAEIEDVVNAVLFLLSDKSSMLNGVVLPVDGGFSC